MHNECVCCFCVITMDGTSLKKCMGSFWFSSRVKAQNEVHLNTTGATSGAGTACHIGAPGSHMAFNRGS